MAAREALKHLSYDQRQPLAAFLTELEELHQKGEDPKKSIDLSAMVGKLQGSDWLRQPQTEQSVPSPKNQLKN